MRECRYCQVKCNDNDINCPLCGAHTEVVDVNTFITPGFYPDKPLKKSKKPVVKNIFISILTIIVAGMFVSSLLSNIWALFFITIAAEAFIWLAILRFVFYPHNTRQIIAGVFTWVITFTNLICLHFYCNGLNGVDGAINALNISVGIITPTLLAIVNVVYLAIVFIGGNWYRYAYQTIRLSIIEIAMFFLTYLCGFTTVASIVCSAFGITTILFSLIFGRNVLFAEFKKRFHI